MVDEASIRAEVTRLAGLIDACGLDVPGFDPRIDGGYPFLRVDDDGSLHWIVRERGKTLEHRTTHDVDELLYWAFAAVTASLASRWAAGRRVEGQDSREPLWARQAELLGRLNDKWAERWSSELESRLEAWGQLAAVQVLRRSSRPR